MCHLVIFLVMVLEIVTFTLADDTQIHIQCVICTQLIFSHTAPLSNHGFASL